MANNFNSIFNKLKFDMRETIVELNKNNTFIYRGDQQGRDVLLKIIPTSNVEKIMKQKREVAISNSLKNDSFKFTRSIDCGEEGEYFWVTRLFIPGEALSQTTTPQIGPLCHYDYLNKKFVDSLQIIPKIIHNLSSLQNTNISGSDLNVTRRYPTEILNDSRMKETEKILNFNFENHLFFYNENKDQYLAKDNLKPCMGDLIPPNIIISSDVYFADIEYFCIDNYMMDLSLLWIYLWRYKNWQQLLVKDLSPLDKKFLKLSVIRILLPHYVEVAESLDQDKIVRYKEHGIYEHLINIKDEEI